MKKALTIATVATITQGQEFLGATETVEADIIPKTGNKPGMKASWNIIEGEYSMLFRSLNVWAVNLYSTLSGNLVENNVYQFYYYFEDK